MSMYCYNVGEPSVSINGGVQISFEPSDRYKVTATDKTTESKMDVCLFYTILTPTQMIEHIKECTAAVDYLINEYDKSPIYIIEEDGNPQIEDEDSFYDCEEKAKQDAEGMNDIFPNHNYTYRKLTFWEYHEYVEGLYGDYM